MVCHQLLALEAHGQSHGTPYRIYGGQSGIGAGISPRTWVSPCQLSFHQCFIIIFIGDEKSRPILDCSLTSLIQLNKSVINNIKESNPYCLPILLYDKFPASHRCTRIISSFIFRYKRFCFSTIISGFKKSSVSTSQNIIAIWMGQNLSMHLCSCVLWDRST